MVGSGAWQRVNTQVPIRSPRYAVFDLAEGKEYNFRVLSANIYGTSEPSKPTEAIQTQELKGRILSIFSLLHFAIKSSCMSEMTSTLKLLLCD